MEKDNRLREKNGQQVGDLEGLWFSEQTARHQHLAVGSQQKTLYKSMSKQTHAHDRRHAAYSRHFVVGL